MGVRRVGTTAQDSDRRAPKYATFTSSGASAGNLFEYAIQLQDSNRRNLNQAVAIPFYISSDAAGQSPLSTAISCSLAGSTDGAILETIANSAGLLICESNGDVDMRLGDSLARSVYINLCMPDGTIVTSSELAITS